MLELRQLAWMLLQWKRFKRMVWGATGTVWILCCSGVLLLPEEDFIVRIALLVMLVLCTIVSVYLLLVVRREVKELNRLTIETRAIQQQEKAGQAASSRP